MACELSADYHYYTDPAWLWKKAKAVPTFLRATGLLAASASHDVDMNTPITSELVTKNHRIHVTGVTRGYIATLNHAQRVYSAGERPMRRKLKESAVLNTMRFIPQTRPHVMSKEEELGKEREYKGRVKKQGVVGMLLYIL